MSSRPYAEVSMRRLFAILPIVILLCASPVRAEGDLLGQVRQQVNAPAEPCPNGKKDKNKDKDKEGDCDNQDFGLGPLLEEALLAPFLVPTLALHDDYQTYSLFPRFPYAGGLPGDLWLDENRTEDEPKPHGLRGWAVQANLEDGYDTRGVNRVGARLFLDTTFRFGISSNWDFFTERRPGGVHDELTLGDANLTFRFAQSEWMEMYAGVGGRLTADRCDSRGGFNFTYGGQVFPCKPVVIASSLDLGTLGSASVVRVRSTVGLIHRHWELFGGYDYLRIGNADLQGPLAGLRLWL
jgi:hypothetical protein